MTDKNTLWEAMEHLSPDLIEAADAPAAPKRRRRAGKALLTKVDLSGVVIAGDGSYRSGVLSLSFIEYAAEGTGEDGSPAETGPGIKAARIQLAETMVKA